MAKKLEQFTKCVKTIQTTPVQQLPDLFNKFRSTYTQLTESQQLSQALYCMANYAMNLKDVQPHIDRFVEKCILDVIDTANKSKLRSGSEAIRQIFIQDNEYYKNRNLDRSLEFPLGKERPIQKYQPQIGEQCDVVKPYITSTSYCGWTRCTYLGKQGKNYVIMYVNTQAPVNCKEMPTFAPLGTRTLDYQWRINLDIGSRIDAMDTRSVWHHSTITEIAVENGSKRVRVSYRIFDQAGDKKDEQGNKYFGLGPNEDEWLDIMSPRIQKEWKMQKGMSKFIPNNQYILDDHYDLIFEKQYNDKPFHGIMRLNFCRSLSLLTFYNRFVEGGGLQHFKQSLVNSEYLRKIPFDLMVAIASICIFVPRMALQTDLDPSFTQSRQFLINNIKHLNTQRLQIAFYFLTTVGKRLRSIQQKESLLHEFRRQVVLVLLTQNLEKKMLAIRVLYDLIRPPIIPYSETQKANLLKYLKQNRIFYMIYNQGVHDQILFRSIDVLKYMVDTEAVEWEQLEYLWNLVPLSDLKGRVVLEKFFAELTKTIPIKYVDKILEKLLNLKENQISIQNLQLLRQLKQRADLSIKSRLAICYYLWDIITVKSSNVTTSIQEEAEKVFKGVVSTLKDLQIKANLLKIMSKRLSQAKILKNQVVLIKDYLLTYPKTYPNKQNIMQIQGQYQTIYEAVNYLKSQKIYDTILILLQQSKNSGKISEILSFLRFLFEEDNDDITHIVKTIYAAIGPNDIFLNWAETISYRILNFFQELFETKDLSAFSSLTLSGFHSLHNILLDINASSGNLRIVKSNVTVVTTTTATTTSTSTNEASSNIQSTQKPEMRTFVFILSPPTKMKGMRFLQELMFVVNDNKVYDEVVKLIISFVVDLDESLSSKIYEIRKEFLMSVVSQIEKLNQANVMNKQIQKKFESYISLIQFLFSATQKNGLGELKPHNQFVVGEIFDLKFTNNYQKDNSDFIVKINENATVWTLKKYIADILKIQPSTLDIYKYQTPMNDELNGKLVSDMFYNNQQLKIDKKVIKQIPRHDLLNQDKSNLSEKFSEIIQKWFNTYQTQPGKMGMQGLKTLASACWKGSLFKQQNKLDQIFKKYDDGEKGFLTQLEFRNFFIAKSIQNFAAIWRLINLSGYRNDFKPRVQSEEQRVDQNLLPRKILSDPKVYEILFSLLSNQTFKELHINFYKLIQQLETDKVIKQQLLNNGSIEFNETSNYLLSYYVEIINWLMNDDKSNFYEVFLKSGGCKKLLEILIKLTDSDTSLYEYDNLLKSYVIPNILKTLNMYYCPYHLQRPVMNFVIQFRLNQMELDDLLKKIEPKKDSKGNQILEIHDLKQIQQRQIVTRNIEHIDLQGIKAIGYRIFANLVKFYSNVLLPKMINQVSRILACSIIDPNLNYTSLLQTAKSQSLNIRRISINICFLNIREFPANTKNLLNELLRVMPNESKYIYSDYFVLMHKILDKSMEIEKTQQNSAQLTLNYIQLGQMLINKILNYPENEKRGTLYGDKVLLGLLVSLNLILCKKQEVSKVLKLKLPLLIQKCLFFYGAKQRIEQIQISQQLLKAQKQAQIFPDYIKCKSDDSRKVLYQIIEHLQKHFLDQEPKFYSKFVMPIINELKEPRKTQTKISKVGLTNFGSTCYLNSMMQVLNAVGPFRNALMKADLHAPLIEQLKKLFSFLYFSERIDYAPKGFLDAFSQPINPGIQQDTTQFLNFLFDNLQRVLKDSPEESLLGQIFRGSTVAQMICHACGAKRQKKQQFFTYDVDIEGKYDLKSALQGMHQGEVIADCLCQNCLKKSDTTKRSLLNDIPNVFFVHLRRIVFNYDVFMNTKIHTRLEFPQQFSVQPFTKEGLQLREKLGIEYMKNLAQNEEEKKKFQQLAKHGKQKGYYDLKLKGVIVHSGSADVGHYVAIVERENGWIKFDDSRVTIFGMSSFDSDCYGGTWSGEQWGGLGSSSNAYVLVYQRVYKDPITIGKGEYAKTIEYKDFQTFNTPQAYRQVWLDNHQLMLETHLLSELHCKQFIKFTCKVLSNSPAQDKVSIISELIQKVCVYSGYVGDLQQLFLKNLHQINEEILRNYILKDEKKTFQILFHSQRRIRDFYSTYLKQILLYNYRYSNDDTKKEIIKFLDRNLDQLHGQVAKNWLRCGGYFKMFYEILAASENLPELYNYFLNKNLISVFIDFFMQKSSPISISQKKYSLGTKTNPVSFEHALQSILFLVKRSYGFNGQNYQLPKIPEEQLFHLSQNDVYCLSCLKFYEMIIRQRQNLSAIASIIQRLCIKNVKFSQAISRVLLKCINQITDAKDQMIDLCHCISEILIIRDQYWTYRAQCLLGFATPYVFEPNSLTSLDDDKFVYGSILEDLFPIQCLFAYAHINRLRNPIAVTHILFAILRGCCVSQQAMVFLGNQFGPSFVHRNYLDWVKPFLETVSGFVNLDKKKKEQFETQIKDALLYIKDIEQFNQKNKQKLPKSILIGDFCSKNILNEFKTNSLLVTCKEIQAYTVDIQPIQQRNQYLRTFLQHNRLTRTIHPSSNILKIFKQNKPAIALKMQQEQHQEKAIMSLFDEDVSTLQQKPQSMQVELSKKEQQQKKEQQRKKQEEKKKQQQEKLIVEEELPVVDIKGLKTVKYFYKIQVENKVHSNIAVIVQFDKNSQCNAFVPNKVYLEVMQKGSESFYLAKRNPNQDWGQIKFQIVEKEIIKSNKKVEQKQWFRTYEYKEQKFEQENVRQPMQEQKSNYQAPRDVPEAAQISCPVCTFLNSSYLERCDLCSTPLRNL